MYCEHFSFKIDFWKRPFPLEKAIKESFNPFNYTLSSTEAEVGLIQPRAAGPEVPVLKCWFFHWCGWVFQGFILEKNSNTWLLNISHQQQEWSRDTPVREDATHAILQKISYDSNLKDSRCFEFLSRKYLMTPTWKIPDVFSFFLVTLSQFALGQFLE